MGYGESTNEQPADFEDQGTGVFDVSQATWKWPEILARLGVEERFLSGKHGPCPFCGGKDRFRFTDKDGAGMWICSQCSAGNGMQFVMKHRQVDFKAAVKLVAEILPSTQTVKPVKPKADRNPLLRKMWAESLAIKRGDPVWQYLEARKVLPAIIPGVLRYLPDAEYFHQGRKAKNYPAMIAMVRDGEGKPKTIHCTYLEDGKKAPVESPKKVLSPMGASPVIQLYDPTDTLCLCEGIETALAVRIRTGKPVWATVTAGGMKAFICPPGVSAVEVWADNDTSLTGQTAAYTLASRLINEGKKASVKIPVDPDTDWADA